MFHVCSGMIIDAFLPINRLWDKDFLMAKKEKRKTELIIFVRCSGVVLYAGCLDVVVPSF